MDVGRSVSQLSHLFFYPNSLLKIEKVFFLKNCKWSLTIYFVLNHK